MPMGGQGEKYRTLTIWKETFFLIKYCLIIL